MKIIKITLIVSIIFLFVYGCSTFPKKISSLKDKEIGVESVHDSFTIKGGGMYEECIELKPGQVFDYDYDATDFVNFNIHYHGHDKVHYPATKKGAMFGQGMIDPGEHDYFTKDQEFYCLMWDNTGDEKVEVSFSCTLRNK